MAPPTTPPAIRPGLVPLYMIQISLRLGPRPSVPMLTSFLRSMSRHLWHPNSEERQYWSSPGRPDQS